MTLTQQFLILALFPLSFLGMLVYARRQSVRQSRTAQFWQTTLLLGALWASSVMRFFVGAEFALSFAHSWGVIGRYAFSLLALLALFTTLQFLATPREKGMLLVVLSGALILASLILDPAIWGTYLPPFRLGGVSVRQFDLWGGVWIAGWLLALLAGWLLTRQTRRRLPLSLYLNQVNYWSLVLGLLAVGGLVAAAQQPGQPFWQQAGLLLVIPAALLGTLSISRDRLPDLEMVLRLLLRRLSGTLIIFGLAWLALWGLAAGLAGLPAETGSSLLLVLAAALFAGLFVLTHALVERLMARFFSSAAGQEGLAEREYQDLLAALPAPQRLAHAFGALLQARLGIREVWLFVPEDGPGGELLLRPLSSTSAELPATAHFAADSPFTRAMRDQRQPLLQHDVDILPDFREMNGREREILQNWQRVLYLPVLMGKMLVAVLVLDAKQGGLPYQQADLTRLQQMTAQFGPLLFQARNMAHLQRVNDFAFAEKQALGRENRQLKALNHLVGRFLQHLTPDLKRPLHNLAADVATLPDSPDDTLRQSLQSHLNQLEEFLDRLLQAATRLQNRAAFQEEAISLENIARTAQRRLQAMAEARQVHVEFANQVKTPLLMGDAEQLTEAVQYLLHNAIKFNRVGGVVSVTSGAVGGDIYLRISDQGVGIPPAELSALWTEFPSLQSGQNGNSGRRTARLGLTLAQYIVRAHGGRIEAESQYGAGSTFTVYLPLEFAES